VQELTPEPELDVANPYERNAREQKAQAIVGTLWQAAGQAQRRDPELPTTVRLFNQAQRDQAAEAAGQHAPSRETWDRVVHLIGERHRQEVSAEGFPKACPSCNGEGLVAVRAEGCNHNGNCPCGSDEIPCGPCDGTGLELCSDCGNHPATRLNGDGEDTCELCAVWLERRPPQPVTP
jgi:hypothetical protein